MQPLVPSLEAYKAIPGDMTHCSWRAGWRSLLLRGYRTAAGGAEFTTLPTSDHLIVLVTSGSFVIESRRGEQWHRARYEEGSLGMTVAGEPATLRWRDAPPHGSLHLHLPTETIRAVAEELWPGTARPPTLPNSLKAEDPLIRQIMLALGDALGRGVPDLYAETSAHLLAMRLLLHHGSRVAEPRQAGGGESARLRRATAYMRENLAEDVSLEELSRQAGLSRFHFLRVFKQAHGETPFRHLARLRMRRAAELLGATELAVTQVAFECGYENPGHFASAFRRATGVSPREFRRRGR
jgi:AraC family transcriptional regulator